ncbi:MAG: hypothetical protein RMJ15_10830 [Nitrososphaerota archaeon]|nr:hypothetical protein [Nitrososphaerota archaeon]
MKGQPTTIWICLRVFESSGKSPKDLARLSSNEAYVFVAGIMSHLGSGKRLLERNGLIEGTWNERKRVYKLTEKGVRTIETILSANDKIKNFITSLLKVQT